jgi:phospholipid/cholesterol/gamma-HCH transport system permease protein
MVRAMACVLGFGAMSEDLPSSPWIERRVEDEADVLYLSGAWQLANVEPIEGRLRALGLQARERFILDGSRLEGLDTSASFILLKHLSDAGCTQAMLSARGFDPRHERLLALVRERMTTPPAAGHTVSLALVQRVGAAALVVGGLLRSHVDFVGLVALELINLVRRPGLFRLRETVSQFEAVCINAIPIVALVNFLIGVVIAYVLGVQAQRYGANVFVADGIALAVCRELSPILCAVLMAGRSGAAFTAQIGTMKVEEEIDAISTLGLSPIQVLVIPRLVALVVALPLLVFVGDIAGILGGMLIGSWQLDIAPNVFMNRVHGALELRHFVVGLAKAPVFAVFVALIACGMGLKASRDARSLGENTTSTVVQCIVWVIVIDAAFAVALQRLGI